MIVHDLSLPIKQVKTDSNYICLVLVLVIPQTDASVCYLCDFVVRDIKIAVYLESPRKINFNLVTFFVSEISQKLFLTIIDKVAIYLDL